MNRKTNKSLHLFCRGLVLIPLLISLTACAGANRKDGALETRGQQLATDTGAWTRVSGDSDADRRGVYGTQGIPAADNTPGGRTCAAGWIDGQDNLWLFGGRGYVDKRLSQHLNDLWKFDGSNWTWISGDNTGSRRGVYGTRGVAGSTNKPGARQSAVSWIDAKGNLWLFGGEGFAGKRFLGSLNDLWKFDGTNWTWVSGDQKIDQKGDYGERGIAADTNTPGGRYDAVGWTDPDGNLWLFGGFGFDQYGAEGYLNDLWKFDGTRWTWVSGDGTRNKIGDYGTLGVAAATNKPGARTLPVTWTDADGALWLFGGNGLADFVWEDTSNLWNTHPTGTLFLNDLWKFDGTSWTWVAGTNRAFHKPPVDSDEMKGPPSMFSAVGWSDAAGNLWLLGGHGPGRVSQMISDLWKFDGTDWTRVQGDDVSPKERDGVSGTRGADDAGNSPEARWGAVAWTDSRGDLWLFGGWESTSINRVEYFNDLWKFEP